MGYPTTSSISDFIDARIGRPFQIHGRGPHAYDCLGFALEAAAAVFGIALPDPLRLEAIEEFRTRFFRLPSPAAADAGDWVYFRSGPKLRDQHVAIVEDWKWLAEAHRDHGIRRVRRETLGPEAQFYRPRCSP